MVSSTISGFARLATGGAALALASMGTPALAQFAESHDTPETTKEEDYRGTAFDWMNNEEVSEYSVEAADDASEASAEEALDDDSGSQPELYTDESDATPMSGMPGGGGFLHLPYRQVAVHGAGSAGFLYVRQDNFLGLEGATNADKVEAMNAAGAFGPHPEGAKVRAKPGHSYYFFPLCGGTPRWEAQTFQYIPDEGEVEVTLSCPE